mmetsp:Transcript_1621/g.4823  ORF Transcript_1621/g.4823 Transcript_1621/m.4823 type:complete len:335 (+) Transcript_1621:3-1007(+)
MVPKRDQRPRKFWAFAAGLVVGGLVSSLVHTSLQQAQQQKGDDVSLQQPRRHQDAEGGVAVTVVPARKRLTSVAAAMAKLATVVAASPWPVDAYVRDDSIELPRGVRAVQLPASLARLDQRGLLLSVEFWATVRHRRVLFFELGSTVMCGAAPLRADDALFAEYGWVGARWKWAKNWPHVLGGNGAFSLRDRDELIAALKESSQPVNANEDRWFVRTLAERGAALAPGTVSDAFAAEEIFASDRTTAPVGVYHLLKTLPYHNRSALLRLCPEAKLLFPANHDPRCALRCPRNRTLLAAPLADWAARCRSPHSSSSCDLTWTPRDQPQPFSPLGR